MSVLESNKDDDHTTPPTLALSGSRQDQEENDRRTERSVIVSRPSRIIEVQCLLDVRPKKKCSVCQIRLSIWVFRTNGFAWRVCNLCLLPEERERVEEKFFSPLYNVSLKLRMW